jgi:nucleotide-binding universal stress UspA family protein
MPRIVVGVDGSEQSKTAFRWALEEARLRGATVQAVYAWAIRFAGGMGVVVPQPTVEEEAEQGERMLDAVIAEVGAGDVDVERVAVEGGPARVLVETARGADLLVVGSRGHGGFAGLLLGSVSQQCATHAPCPVVIVRSRDRS